MPFRGAEYRERCAACEEQADGCCPRCARPTCAEHRAPDQLCAGCEAEYRKLEVELLTARRLAIRVDLLSVAVTLALLAIYGAADQLLLHHLRWYAEHRGLCAMGAVVAITALVVLLLPDKALKAAYRRRAAARLRARFIAGRVGGRVES